MDAALKRPSSHWLRMVALFCVAGVSEVCAYGQVTAFTPLHLPTIGVPPADVAFWVGAITSLSNLAGVPFLPFWGALADRFGRKALIVRSFVVAFVALFLAAIAPNVWVFTFSRAFQSLGLGNTGLMLATLSESAPAARAGVAFGLVNGANPVGAFLGPLVGGPIVDRVGLAPLLAFDAAVIAGVAALLVFGYRDAFVPPRTREPLLRMAWDGVLVIVRSPRLRTLFPAYFVLFSGWLMAYIYIPVIVPRVYSGPDPASAIGLVLGAGGVGTLIATPAIGAVADRVGHWRTLFVGGAVTAVLWLLPYFTRDILTLGVVWAIANGVVSGVFSVSFNVLSSSATDTTRGRVMTFGYLPGNMGFVIGPAIGTVLAARDVFLVFPAAAAMTALGVAIVAYAARQPVAREPAA